MAFVTLVISEYCGRVSEALAPTRFLPAPEPS